MKSMVYCHICKKYLKHMNAFLTHHRWHHGGMTTKEYYDIYLKKPGEEICETPDCNNLCNFATFTSGYYKHCSKDCSFNYLNKNGIMKKSNIKKYGFYNNNRKKAKQTCIEKYSVENISQIDEVKRKKEKTSLKNNGYKYYVGSDKHKQWMKDGGAAYCNRFIKNPSKPQVELYEKILKLCPYAIMNYPCLRYSIDIAIPFLNIAIEYDGGYWHENKYDEKRDKKITREGWKIFRFRDRIPNNAEISRICNAIYRDT